MPESDGHYKVVTLFPPKRDDEKYFEAIFNKKREEGWKFVSMTLEYNNAMTPFGEGDTRTFIAVFEKMAP